MAAASGGVNTSVAAAGKNMTANGLVISIGLEKYIGRAREAVEATRPLIASMSDLTRVSENLSTASAGAIQFDSGKIQTTHAGISRLASGVDNTKRSTGAFVGGLAVMLGRLATAATLFATFGQLNATVANGSKRAAAGINLASAAASTFAGSMSPMHGATNGFVNLMQLLPGTLGRSGNAMLAAGLAFGALTGGIGPLSAGIGLMGAGFRGIPGPAGTVVTALGSVLAMAGVTSVAVKALSASLFTVAKVMLFFTPGLVFGVKLAAQAEQAQIAFEVMLGSAQAASKALGDIRKFAAETPFQEGELIAAGRALIAFGEHANNVVPAMKRIGDISSGIGAPIGEIAELYGKARVQGRLFAMDINQLTGRGIPVIQELAKQFRVTDGEVKKLVADGLVEFRHLERAFVSLTSAGGIFFNLTQKQSQSLAGLWSTFADSVKNSLKKVGQEFVNTNVLQETMATMANMLRAMEAPLVTFASLMGWTAKKVLLVSQVFIGFALITNDIAGSTNRFTQALKIAIPLLAAVAAGIAIVVTAQKAYQIAQIATLSLSGPKGWAIIAGGAAVAAAAVWGFGKAAAAADAAIREASKKTDELAANAAKVQAIKLTEDGMISQLSLAQEYLQKNLTTAEKLQAELGKIKIAFGDDRSAGMQIAQKGAINDSTGVYTEIAQLNDELDILTGKATEAEVKVRNLMKAGAPDWLASHAGKLTAQIAEAKTFNDAIADQQRNAKQREEKLARDAEESRDRELKRRKDRSKEIIEANKTPYQKLQDQLKETAALVKSGDLSKSEALKANKRLIIDFATGKQDQKDNTSLQANTAEAMKSIIAAITLRDPQAKVEDLLKSIDSGTSVQTATLNTLGDKFAKGWEKVKAAKF